MRARSAAYGLLSAVVVACWLVSEAWGQQPISWQPNVDIAKRMASQTNRLVLIHFWSPSCGPCQRMENEVFSRPEVAAAIETAYVPVKLNADYFPATARQFGVTALPTDVVITPQGQVVETNVGALSLEKYCGMLNQVAAHVRREAIPGYDQLPMASIPGGPAPSAANPSLPSGYPANPYAAQTVNPEAASGGVALQPPSGLRGSPEGMPSGAAPSGMNAALTPPGGTWAGPGMPPVSSYSGSSPAPRDPASAMPDLAQANSGRSLPGGSPTGMPDAGLGAYAPSTGSPKTQPPVGWQTAIGQPAVGLQSPSTGLDSASAATGSSVHPGNPPLCLDGYCAVQLSERERWVKGDPRWGAIHRGRTYLFAGPEEQKRFFADPDRYSPVLSGNDVVMAAEQNQMVPGRREFGVWFEGRVYLFSSEDSLRRFDADPYRYSRTADPQPRSTLEANHTGMAAGYGSGGRY